MEAISGIMPLAKQIMTLMEKQFGNKAEIVLTDLAGDSPGSILDIRNGSVTGRKAGDDGSNLGVEVMPGTRSGEDRFNYITTIRDGKILRSSTIHLKDERGAAVAALSVHTDITETLQLESFLRQHNGFEYEREQETLQFHDVNSLLDDLICEGQRKVGKPAEEMNKVEKVEFIRYLDEKGAFLITKSGEKICELLEISKFTFYSYLEKSRSRNEMDEE